MKGINLLSCPDPILTNIFYAPDTPGTPKKGLLYISYSPACIYEFKKKGLIGLYNYPQKLDSPISYKML